MNYDKFKNRKTQEKKRIKFRKLIRNKFKLENNRLQYLYKFNNKKRVNIIYEEKKRNKFRKLIKNKFKLENNRLQYLYKFNNKEKWVNIIYEEEKIPL